MQVGVAQTDVTPPVGTPMGGYRSWRFAHGTRDPLRATAVVLEGSGCAVAVCSCDVVWLSDEMVAAVRERVARRTDLAAGAVLVCATHTHSGAAVGPPVYPNLPKEEWETELIERLAAVVVAAAADRRPGRVAAGTADERSLLENRRCEYRAQRDPTDRDDLLHQLETGQRSDPEDVDESAIEEERATVDGEVAVLAAETPGGDPLATVLGFACHPTNVGGEQRDRYSADYIGVARDRLRDTLGEDHRTAFGLGACGELRPADQSGIGAAIDVGEALAADAAAVHDAECVDAAVDWTAETRRVERRTPTAEHVAAARDRLADESGSDDDNAIWAAHETLRLADGPARQTVEVWAGRVGDTALLALPGEVFCEHGRAIKRRSPFDRTVVVTLANGYCGYVPTEAAFERGGYEVTLAASSYLARDAGAEMVSTAVDLLGELSVAFT